MRSTTFDVIKISPWTRVAPDFPKKHHLGLENSSESSGLEKMLKIVSCAATKKMKELMVGVQME